MMLFLVMSKFSKTRQQNLLGKVFQDEREIRLSGRKRNIICNCYTLASLIFDKKTDRLMTDFAAVAGESFTFVSDRRSIIYFQILSYRNNLFYS